MRNLTEEATEIIARSIYEARRVADTSAGNVRAMLRPPWGQAPMKERAFHRKVAVMLLQDLTAARINVVDQEILEKLHATMTELARLRGQAA